jgi:hypothetical protein
MTPSLIVVHANRHGKLSAEPRGIETKLMGSTLCFGGTKRVTLPRTRLGALFTDDWSHCGAVVLLDHLRSNEFFYACTVFLNPRAKWVGATSFGRYRPTDGWSDGPRAPS